MSLHGKTLIDLESGAKSGFMQLTYSREPQAAKEIPIGKPHLSPAPQPNEIKMLFAFGIKRPATRD